MTIRILCLHGGQQNGDVFRNQLSKLEETLRQDDVEMVFVDAPHLLEKKDGDAEAMRSWSKSVANNSRTNNNSNGAKTDNSGKLNPYEESDEMVSALVAGGTSASLSASLTKKCGEGGFDVILGFSQGAMMAQRYIMLDAIAHRAAPPRLRSVVLACCPDPREVFPELVGKYTSLHLAKGGVASSVARTGEENTFFDIPSLHIVGLKDSIVAPSASLSFAEACGSLGTLLTHDHAHSVPQLQSIVQGIRSFIDWTTADQSAQAALQEARQDEIDMIVSMFGEESFIPAGPAEAAVGRFVFPLIEDAESLSGGSPSDLEKVMLGAKLEFVITQSYPNTQPRFRVLCGPEGRRTVYLRWHGELVLQLADHLSGLLGSAMMMPALMFVREYITQENNQQYLDLLAQCVDGAGKRGSTESAGDAAAEGPSVNDEWTQDEDIEQRMTWIHEAQAHAQRILKNASVWETDANDNPSDAAGLLESQPREGGNATNQLGSGGSLTVTIGLIGKPSAGKSTFFNAVTDPDSESKAARIAAFPFTTIDPNVGTGFGPVFCPCGNSASAVELDGECSAAYGHVDVSDVRHRRHPIIVKDVAGLVRGAYMGRGKGNKFLNDLCDADVLVHVVDGAGATDADGAECPIGTGSTQQDITWVRDEVHCWIYDNVRAKWDIVKRKPERLRTLFTGYQCSSRLVDAVLVRAGLRNEREVSSRVPGWGPRELHLLIAAFVHMRFPIVVALNKSDLTTAAAHYKALHETYPNEVFVPMAAKVEWNLLQLRQAGVVTYISGEESFKVIGATSSKPQESMLKSVTAFFQREATQRTGSSEAGCAELQLNGTTGIQAVLADALSRCRASYVFPVPALKPKVDGRLQHCLTFKPGTTVDDVFWTMCRAGLTDGKLVRFEALNALTPSKPVAVLHKEDLMPAQYTFARVLSNKRNPAGIVR